MNEQTTKRIEQLTDILEDIANALEAVAVKLKREVKELGSLETTKQEKLLEKRMKEARDFKPNLAEQTTQLDRTALPFDAGKIHWVEAEGKKGKYELSEDFENPEHKALVKFLEPVESIPSDGWFYWLFGDGVRVGRKPRKELKHGWTSNE